MPSSVQISQYVVGAVMSQRILLQVLDSPENEARS